MTATVLSLVLTLGIVLAALKAMSEVLAHRSLFAALRVGALLAARLAVDDPILAATLVLYLAVIGPVAYSHLRRHDAEIEVRVPLPALILGLVVALLFIVGMAPTFETAELPGQDRWPTTGLLVLISAVTLLIGTTLAVRIREGRRQ